MVWPIQTEVECRQTFRQVVLWLFETHSIHLLYFLAINCQPDPEY